MFCDKWQENATWEDKYDGGPHEANFLKLDCSKLKHTFGWKCAWNVEEAIEKTVEWSKVYRDQGDIVGCMNQQMDEFYKKVTYKH